jgi:hypothetical protein
VEQVIETLQRLAAEPIDDPAAAAAEVRRSAGDDRAVLEAARVEFQRRVRRRSDDHVAQRAIRLIAAALGSLERRAQYTHFNQTAYR